MSTRVPLNQSTRSRAHHVSDNRARPEFDDVARAAATLFNVSIGAISVVDEECERFISSYGFVFDDHALDESLGAHVVERRRALSLRNPSTDSPFAACYLVSERPRIRFYLGVPLVASNGAAFGVLAVMDTQDRELPQESVRALELMADGLAARFEAATLPARDASPHESEPDYAAVFANIPAPVALLDPETFAFVDTNQAFLDATGSTHGQLLGKPFYDPFPNDPDDPSTAAQISGLRASFERVKETGRAEVRPVQRYPIPQKDRFEERYWTAVNAPVFDANGRIRFILHMPEDITSLVNSGEVDTNTHLEVRTARLEADVKRYAAELERASEHLRLAQHVANIGSWQLVPGTGQRYWSDEMYRITGASPEVVAQRDDTLYEAVHPDDREEFHRVRDRIIAGKEMPDSFEHRIVRPDGEVRIVRERIRATHDESGKPTLMFGTLEDITDQKRTEAEIATRAHQQAAVAELGEAALQSRDLNALFDHAVRVISETLDVELCKVLRLTPDEDEVELVSGIGWQEGLVGNARVDTGSNSQAGYTLASNTPVIVDDLRTESRFSGPALLRDHGVISGVSVVILDREKAWGVLGAHTRERRRFTTDDVNFFQSVANILSAAIQRDRIEAEVAMRARQQDAVARLGQEALKGTEIPKLLQDAAALVADTLGIEFCKILERTRRSDNMLLVAGVGWKPGYVGRKVMRVDPDSHAGYTLRQAGPVRIDDLREETRFKPSAFLLEHGAVSGISVAISGEKEAWGVLGAHSSTLRTFTQDDVNFCQSVANVLAEAIQRAETTDSLRKSENLRRIAGHMAQLGAWQLNSLEGRFHWSDEVCEILEVSAGTRPTLNEALGFVVPEHQDRIRNAIQDCLLQGVSFDIEIELNTAKEHCIWARVLGQPMRRGDGDRFEIQGALQDISAPRHAAAEMRDLAHRLTTTLESITDAFFTLDDEWRFTYVNRRAEQLLRRTRDELLGQVVWEAFPYTTGTVFQEQYQRAVDERQTVEFQAFYQPLDIWMGVKAYPSPAGLAVYFRDITREKHNETALMESEERFRLVSRATADTIWDWNLETDAVWWNEGMRTFFGYEPDEIEPDSRSFKNRIAPDDKDRVISILEELLNDGSDEWQSEFGFIRRDGSIARVDVRGFMIRDDAGRPIRMVGSMNDVTQQRDYEEKLEQQAALLDRSQDAIIVRDMDDRITFWNRSAERIYGWSAADALGKRKRDLLNSDPEMYSRATHALRETGEWTGQILQQRKDGSRLTVEVAWSLVTDDAGDPQAVLTIDTDITDRLVLEEQLRQSQRLEAVGQLTGGVAHDFNNLLTVILGNAELLSDQLPADSRLRKLAEMTRGAAVRGAELTHRLLAFARKQALEPKSVDVNTLVSGLEGLLRRALPESIDIEVETERELWGAFVDPAQLESVLLNLALNAKDAMPEGGQLMIETSNKTLDEEYAAQHAEVAPGRYVMVAVSDTGTGIPKDLIDRVFDPFFTTKETGKGTGLGLSMAYGFAKQSGGHIKIYSERGQGTSVKVYLPRAQQPGDVAESPGHSTAEVGGSEKILVVEDDELVRMHAESQLEEFGYRVIAASNGEDALEVLEQEPDIDLLFTDVIMSGGMNGRELAEVAKRLRPKLKVLYTSGYTENAIVHHGRLDEGVQLLQKPYRRHDLAKKIRAVLSEDSEKS